MIVAGYIYQYSEGYQAFLTTVAGDFPEISIFLVFFPFNKMVCDDRHIFIMLDF